MRTFKLLFRVRDPKIMHRFQVWAESVHGVYCFVWKKSYLTHTLFTHACGWTVLLTRCGVMLTLNADYLYILKNFVTFNTTFLPSNELKQKRIITHLLVKRLIFREKNYQEDKQKFIFFLPELYVFPMSPYAIYVVIICCDLTWGISKQFKVKRFYRTHLIKTFRYNFHI